MIDVFALVCGDGDVDPIALAELLDEHGFVNGRWLALDCDDRRRVEQLAHSLRSDLSASIEAATGQAFQNGIEDEQERYEPLVTEDLARAIHSHVELLRLDDLDWDALPKELRSRYMTAAERVLDDCYVALGRNKLLTRRDE